MHWIQRVWDEHNPRLTYGLAHLGGAVGAIALALLVVAFVYFRLCSPVRVTGRARLYPALAALAVFLLVWFPAWEVGGFVQDDWRLLAAASVRKVVELHPLVSLRMLDSVDGNFRPLGTVLFFGYMVHWFGAAAHAFTAAPLLMLLLSGAVAYAVVRELGYSEFAGAAASILFFSRGMLYTVATWPSALGDGLVICLCGLTGLLTVRACRVGGSRAAAMHVLGWLCFVAGTLAKQSAFATPLIVALVLLLRPGRCPRASGRQRMWSAVLALVVYGSTAAGVFAYAKSLASFPSPYPIELSPAGLIRPFAYLTWYFGVLELRVGVGDIAVIAGFIGIPIVVALIVLARRLRAPSEGSTRDSLFAVLCAGASISLFVVLPTRAAPYYGGMFAFWMSIAFALELFGRSSAEALPSRVTSRVCCGIFCALVFSGFAEVRLEQTGLIPAGGYIWGGFSAYADRSFHEYVRRELASAPAARTVLFENCRDHGGPPAMVLLEAPHVERIVLYDDRLQGYYVNDRQGLRPVDDVAGRTDPWAYNWTVRANPATAQALLGEAPVLRIPCEDGAFAPGFSGR